MVDVVNTSTSRIISVNSTTQVGTTKVRVIKQLAEGAFGIVFLAQDVSESSLSSRSAGSGKSYALKQLICQTKDQVAEAHRELESLQRFAGHPHIIQLVDHSSTALPPPSSSSASAAVAATQHREILMLFPLCSRGTTWDAMLRADALVPESAVPWPFNEKKALFITSCIAKALLFMHSKGYTHRDIKPHNILLAEPAGRGISTEDYRSVGHPLLMDLGSVAVAKCEVKSKPQALVIEEEAAQKTSAAYRYR